MRDCHETFGKERKKERKKKRQIRSAVGEGGTSKVPS
jgi:hypothetical protein